jgi:hypothetical protein
MLRPKSHVWSIGFLLLLTSACTSSPKASLSAVTENQAKVWFANYCSKGLHAQSGDLVIRANTPEFKGQFPASLRFEADGSFALEITNIVGGTVARLQSDGKEMSTTIPSKPKYNREHISRYLGLDLPILSQFLLGDLPCPTTWKAGGVRVSGNQMQIVTNEWKWNFEKSDEASGSVPVRVVLQPAQNPDPKLRIELQIQEWDPNVHYAKKVSVKGAEGELKWAWRSRN